jgi:radical SAM protein with 4Fe4S-binding SPASM domain
MTDRRRTHGPERTLDPLTTSVPTACHAPFVSLYFTAKGDVLACCQSTIAPLGNVTRSSLEDIWQGPRAQALRERLQAFDLPPECRFCQWQVDDGNPDASYARNFDHLTRDGDGWPTQLEFAISNRCNLECVMCNGDFSSTIRARRERRPPLPSVYGDRFFEQLRPFLEHLDVARFLGGEPFLVPEYQRIWDLIVETGRPVACDVTTNGTVWTRRMEATLAALPFSIAVSLDGITRETVEAVRQGAEFDVVMANVDRFAAYCADRGTPFALTYCLMVPNWREFPDFLAFADERGADVFVNTVNWPSHLSLYVLPPDELTAVADELERRGKEVVPGHPVLAAEVERLRNRAAPGTEVPWFEAWSPVPPRPDGPPQGPRVDLGEARARLATQGGTVHTLVTDAEDRVLAVGDDGGFLGTAAEDLVGHPYRRALEAATATLGPLVLVSDEVLYANGAERLALYDGPQGQTRVQTVTVVADGGGGATTLAVIVDEFPGWSAS